MNTDRNPTPRDGRRTTDPSRGNRRRPVSPTRYDGPRYGRTRFTDDTRTADAIGGERESRRRQRPERRHDHDEAREERRRERPGPRRGEGRRGGPERRGRRRDVRGAVLLVLAQEPMHGYQVMQAIAERSNGAWRPSPGAIYPAISALEDEGLLTVSADSGRKVATLTPAGEEAASTLAGGADPFASDTAAGPDLREGVHALAQAAREVSRTGTPAQREQALEVLDRARRALYGILAQEPEASGPAHSPTTNPATHPTTPADEEERA